MSRIHPSAEHGFADAETYERGRPGYPAAAVEALDIEPGMVVADLGCGTGKLTRSLADTPARVVGIEPLQSMLGAFRRGLPGLPVIAATAEALPLAGASMDLVVCASAFHWFDHERAIPEIHRVLGPSGRLAIIWNRRDELEGWAAGFWQITEAHRGDTPGYRSGVWREALESSGLFGPVAEQSFAHVQRTDLDGLLARVASISFIEVLPEAERRAVLDRSKRFVLTHPDTRGRTTFDLPYRTAVYLAGRRDERG